MDRVFRVRSFERPDALREPSLQREIIGETAKQRLTEMDVRLNEARKDYQSGTINDRWS